MVPGRQIIAKRNPTGVDQFSMEKSQMSSMYTMILLRLRLFLKDLTCVSTMKKNGCLLFAYE